MVVLIDILVEISTFDGVVHGAEVDESIEIWLKYD